MALARLIQEQEHACVLRSPAGRAWPAVLPNNLTPHILF